MRLHNEKDVIRKRVLGNNPYRPALLGEIRNYYRDKYSLVSKKSGIKDNFIQCNYAGDKDSYRCLSINDHLKDIERTIYQDIYRKKNQGEMKMTITISEKFSKKNNNGTFKSDDLYIKRNNFTFTRDMSLKDLFKEIGESVSKNREDGIENYLVSSGLSHECINNICMLNLLK